MKGSRRRFHGGRRCWRGPGFDLGLELPHSLPKGYMRVSEGEQLALQVLDARRQVRVVVVAAVRGAERAIQNHGVDEVLPRWARARERAQQTRMLLGEDQQPPAHRVRRHTRRFSSLADGEPTRGHHGKSCHAGWLARNPLTPASSTAPNDASSARAVGDGPRAPRPQDFERTHTHVYLHYRPRRQFVPRSRK